MATSIAHKLRAFRDCQDPRLAFRVVAPALTVEQVERWASRTSRSRRPRSGPAKWRAAMGVGQTEIDALATLRPDLLRRIVRRAVAPYWDASLEDRARKAGMLGRRRRAAFEAQVDAEQLAALRSQAETAVEQLKEAARQMDVATEDLGIEWPEISVPERGAGGRADDRRLRHGAGRDVQILRGRKRYE